MGKNFIFQKNSLESAYQRKKAARQLTDEVLNSLNTTIKALKIRTNFNFLSRLLKYWYTGGPRYSRTYYL